MEFLRKIGNIEFPVWILLCGMAVAALAAAGFLFYADKEQERDAALL